MLQTQPNHGVPYQTTMDFASAEEISMATFMVITAHLAEGRFTFRSYSHCLSLVGKYWQEVKRSGLYAHLRHELI